MTDEGKDKRLYVVLTNEYPRHLKIRPQSDKAFRLYATHMVPCNDDRNDSIISRQDLAMIGPKPREEHR